MRDRPVNGEGEAATATQRPPRPRGLGLSWKVLALTILFVMASGVLIYVPSIANFRVTWLADRMTMAHAAATVLADSTTTVPQDIQDDLLAAIGARAIAIRNGTVSRLLATVPMPTAIDEVIDLRQMDPLGEIGAAFVTLMAAQPRILRVLGEGPSGAVLELVLNDRGLRAAMLAYSFNIIRLAAVISIITAGLLFFAINRMLVVPMRRLTANMVAFADAPEDAARIVQPSRRSDEIGVAEDHLAAMQSDLQATLREQRHLADLGLAVAKVNHDLRNMLASAQLISDRLGSLPDPTVQRFAPKLIAALDRAIAYCQSTLAYGRAREAAPARRLVALERLVEDVSEVLGLPGHATIAFEARVQPGLEIDADPDQLLRVLVNLCRNAMQALDGDPGPAVVRRLTISARREERAVAISVEDTGPGVPEKAKAFLFHAFSGSARPGGTGLGLAIAAELVRAHGGTISLVDAGGPGAVFRIVIPDRLGTVARNNGT
jgi:signal transduction histidine kinase